MYLLMQAVQWDRWAHSILQVYLQARNIWSGTYTGKVESEFQPKTRRYSSEWL